MKPAIVALLLVSTGCSWMAVRRPPEHPDPNRPVECTSSVAPAVLDAAVAAILLAAIVTQDDDCGIGCPDMSPILAPPVLALGLSSVMGFGWSSQCRDAIAHEPKPPEQKMMSTSTSTSAAPAAITLPSAFSP